jgi:transposase
VVNGIVYVLRAWNPYPQLGSGPINGFPKEDGDLTHWRRQEASSWLVCFVFRKRRRARIELYLPLSYGIPRVDDRRVISGIVFLIRNGLRWRDASSDYGLPKSIYNRFIRWRQLGVFNKVFAELAGKGPRPERLMIDATHLNAHRTAASLPKKRGCSPTYRAHQRRAELKVHAVCDGEGRPPVMLLSEGQMSDDTAAALMIDHLPKAKVPLGDKGYDVEGFREALAKRNITPCITSKANRKIQIDYDKVLYKQRQKVEDMFGRIKNWRRIHTRYDRFAHTFMSAIAIAATVIFWLGPQ